MDSRRDFMLLPTVFISGATVMAVEMSASRLLSPYFGDSQLVWANLIGLILIYLTAGYYLGGRLADRWPSDSLLYRLVLWAGFAVGLIPFLARPVLRHSLSGFDTFSASIIIGSFLGIMLLFTVPVILLGCISPFAIRLRSRSVASTGHTAGAIYALSTLGSILGTFLPTLVLIPRVGTSNTFLLCSLTLLLTSLVGLFSKLGARAAWYLLLPLLIILLWLLAPRGSVKPAPGLLYERESSYNYIQVADQGGRRVLMLNEGQAVHSAYRPGSVLSGGVWDYFLLAPYFAAFTDPLKMDGVCMIGLAAGTASKEYTAIYGPLPIDGVELDPEVVDAGRRFFAMDEPNLEVHVEDGRHFLRRTDRTYDVIIVDAYRQPYIPFHLTTREFFALTREHLNEGGVVMVNAGRTATDFRLVDVLAATMSKVFETVFILDVPGVSNSLVVGTQQHTSLDQVHQRLATISDVWLSQVAGQAVERMRVFTGVGFVLTDDRAPVEQLTHSIILRYVLHGE